MSMTPRERIMAILNAEEPDKIPVCVVTLLLSQLPGGWYRRLKERGLGSIHWTTFYTPAWKSTLYDQNPHLPDVKYSQTHYFEKGIWKYRHTYETPVGIITGVMMTNPMAHVALIDTPEEYLIEKVGKAVNSR